MKKAFTLVELLIVIALIAILSVAVLATINPIEQANKARDAAQKNDAAEVLSAYERYYTSQNSYPWGQPGTVGATVVASNLLPFGVSDGAGGEGVLITTSELKASFAAKTPFQTGADAIDMMYTYYDGSDSSYVCYVPKAKANRTLLGMLRCVSPYVDATHGGMQNPGENGCSSIAPTSDEWNDQDTYAVPESAYWMCVPETASASGAGVPTAVVTP